MDNQNVYTNLRETAAKVLPPGSSLYLYGSRARGDYHEDSDWDLLILLNKSDIEQSDYDYVCFNSHYIYKRSMGTKKRNRLLSKRGRR